MTCGVEGGLMLIASDSLWRGRQNSGLIERGTVTCMASAENEVRWPEAIMLTIALWLFVMLVFMPGIIQRHNGDVGSILLDCSTFLVSFALAMPLFALFRATLHLPLPNRVGIMLAGVVVAAVVQTTFDLMFTGWVAANIDSAWSNLARDLARGYESAFRYLLVFLVNVALFQITFSRRREFHQDRQLSRRPLGGPAGAAGGAALPAQPALPVQRAEQHLRADRHQAQRRCRAMTDKLSNFLRSSLNADPSELIMLDEELAITEEYLDIESVRFGERLHVTVDCAPGACEALVPSFLVQPLVENAIKHGVGPSRETVNINIMPTSPTATCASGWRTA
jgi:hypothetical protein